MVRVEIRTQTGLVSKPRRKSKGRRAPVLTFPSEVDRMIEHMFDTDVRPVGLSSGESDLDFDAEARFDGEARFEAEDQLAYETSCRELADGWSDADQHWLPDGLEDLPLTFLAVLVDSVDRSRLNGHDAVRLMQTEARLETSFSARKHASAVEVAYSPPGDAGSPVQRSSSELEYAAAEIAAALTLTRRSGETLLHHALSLTGPLHRVWREFAAGRLSSDRARVFVRVLDTLPERTIDAVLDRALGVAKDLTTGQLRARLHRLVLEADPGGSEHGMQQGLEDRKVVSYRNPDLTGSLGILSAHPHDVAEARSYIHEIALSLKTGDEPRTLGQIENDVAIDLLRGRQFNTGGGGGRTNITVPLATLMRWSDEPGELDGYGPVAAEIARKVAIENTDGEWTFVVTDNRQPVATGTVARRPTEAQKRWIRANYPTCVFPGCRQPATQSDLDHTNPYSEGGATENRNLAPLCRHHHRLRHLTDWKYRRLPGGDHEWTSPLGHTHIGKRDPPAA